MAAFSLLLENKFDLVKKITGAALAMIGGMIASSAGLLPTESASYDVVWEYIVPLSIPLLLMKINVVAIFKETGRLMVAFHFAALGTVIGTFVAIFFMHNLIDNLDLIAPAMTGSYLGGAINFVALVETFNPPADLVNATIVADSGVMIIYFLILIMLSSSKYFRKIFPISTNTKGFAGENEDGINTDYWKPKPIRLVDIAMTLAIAFIIACLSTKISTFFNSNSMPYVVQALLGQKYLILTTLSASFPLVFPKVAKNIIGNEELGTFLIFIFFVTIGLPASLKAVILEAPLMFLFCAIILFFNFLTTIILGRIFKFELEELVLAGVITAGGPMNGVAIAISKQWTKLIVPSMMVGIWGYLIGTFVGYLVGMLMQAKM
jgi:uncharacterized membrane protein